MSSEKSEYLSVTEWSKLHGKDPGAVRRMLIAGRIPGQKIGTQWVISADTPPPPDARVKSGKYRNWRKKD